MASEAASAASVLTLALPLKELQHLAAQLRLLLPGVQDELTLWGVARSVVALG
ncbi:Hypothetical predicted protein [Marmota monax]|uniref:Uncharacterized protein n=1 Tax=Marmota monax TaxID=9995 RepID=A0A5E4CYA4_MARMO|nr:hypothetical protein GHT09_016511 [Marmota monax]VTJ86011.1 Hypothetical predicted protein [Marmota monax]